MKIYKCTNCKKEYLNYLSKKSKYCSRDCFWKAKVFVHNKPHTEESKEKNRENIHPNTVETQFKKGHNNWNHPRAIKSRFKKGLKPWNWVGGKRSPSQIIKDDAKYPKWRERVFKRDKYTCQFCNKKGGYLEAHHVISKVLIPRLAFTVNNGITLCKPCHIKTPNYGARALKGVNRENFNTL